VCVCHMNTQTHTLEHTHKNKCIHTYTHTHITTRRIINSRTPGNHGQTAPCGITQSVRYMELPAKLLDYFLRRNKSNINQSTQRHCQRHGCGCLLPYELQRSLAATAMNTKSCRDSMSVARRHLRQAPPPKYTWQDK